MKTSLNFLTLSVGDPLDLRMFEATKWNLKENDEISGTEISLCTLSPPRDAAANGYYSTDTNIEVIKRFEFVAKLQRMSAIVKDPKETKQRVYVKGSPEVLSTLCKPETLPNDFVKALLIYTQVIIFLYVWFLTFLERFESNCLCNQNN